LPRKGGYAKKEKKKMEIKAKKEQPFRTDKKHIKNEITPD
jgi:hypothetical protein